MLKTLTKNQYIKKGGIMKYCDGSDLGCLDEDIICTAFCEDPVTYHPLNRKPFMYQGKFYTRDEMNALGLDDRCKAAITRRYYAVMARG